MKLQLGSHVTTEKGGGHLIARHRPLTTNTDPLYVIQLFDGTVCATEHPPEWMDQVEEVHPVTTHPIDTDVPAGLRSFLLGDA